MSSFETDPSIRSTATFMMQEYVDPLLKQLIKQGVVPIGTSVEIKFPGKTLYTPHFSYNPDTRIMERNSNEIKIAPKDGKFLALLVSKAGEIVTFGEMTELFERKTVAKNSDVGKDSVFRLRGSMKKIGVEEPMSVIVPVEGIGYRFNP